jgi:alkylation response protein AidB-like acyl-CoA dehydrogenase
MTEFLSTATLPDEYQQLSKTVRDFAREVVAPVAAQHDADHSFPYEVVAGMAEMGLFGLPFPEEYGGMGGDYFALCLALEELAKVDQSVAITLEGGVSLGAMPVYRFGTEAQKQEWLPMLTSGSALGAFGLTEADGGTDAGSGGLRCLCDVSSLHGIHGVAYPRSAAGDSSVHGDAVEYEVGRPELPRGRARPVCDFRLSEFRWVPGERCGAAAGHCGRTHEDAA